MEYVKKNKGVILFYLLLALSTLFIIKFNQRNLIMGMYLFI